jgi:hypothetical protein
MSLETSVFSATFEAVVAAHDLEYLTFKIVRRKMEKDSPIPAPTPSATSYCGPIAILPIKTLSQTSGREWASLVTR